MNRGDSFGELSATFNADLVTMPGKIKASPKLGRVLTSATLDNDIPQALLVHDGRYYFATDDDVFICEATDDPSDPDNWSELTPALAGDSFSGIGLETDMVSFDGAVLISGATDINRYVSATDLNTNDWWQSTVSGTALTSGKTHTLHVHRGGQETLVVADGNKIRYYNSTAGHSTITLDSLFTAHCFASGVNAVWAGTYTESSEYAYVYEFYIGETIDSVPVARNAYRVDGRAILSIQTVDNIPYIVTEKGHIQAYNGAGFTTVAHFPFAYGRQTLDGVQPGLVQDSVTSRPVHSKGMQSDGESLYIFLSSESEATGDPVNERTPSGIWEYNTATQVLNHRSAPSDASTDCGQSMVERSGPLLIANHPNTKFLLGTQLPGTNKYGLFAESTETSCGYVVTSEFKSDNAKDAFNQVYVQADTLQDAEKCVVKYKQINVNDFPVYADINWLSANTFTTTTDISAVLVEDEMEVTEQYGAGKLAHIASIDASSSTYTVTIDEELGATGETSRARFDRWKKVPKTYTDTDGEYASFGLPTLNTWIKAKIAWEGAVSIRGISVTSKAKHLNK